VEIAPEKFLKLLAVRPGPVKVIVENMPFFVEIPGHKGLPVRLPVNIDTVLPPHGPVGKT
jgi:hypothetical protein